MGKCLALSRAAMVMLRIGDRLGQNVTGIEMGQMYVVWDAVPHGTHPVAGFPSFLDSIGIGENGGFAEYMVVDATELIPVVSPAGVDDTICTDMTGARS